MNSERSLFCTSLAIARQRGEAVALATVVAVEGSSYRRPGAKMLIFAGGDSVGSLSGGCLETDAALQGRALLKRAATTPGPAPTQLLHYDTTSDHDLVQGMGLGCQGTVTIFVECLDFTITDGKAAWLGRMDALAEPVMFGTVIKTEGSVGVAPGFTWVLERRNGAFRNDEFALELLAQCVWASGNPRMEQAVLSGGRAEVFIDFWLPPPRLLIFGAGNDAQPLAGFAKVLGWHVTVVDHRPAYLTKERFISVDTVHLCRPEAVKQQVSLPDGGFAAVMTHNYNHDREVLRALLGSPLQYIGLLGPRRRALRLLTELREGDATLVLAPVDLAKLYAPMGLDLGGDGPQTVALSAIAEMQAVLGQRQGSSLRHREGAIHEDALHPEALRRVR